MTTVEAKDKKGAQPQAVGSAYLGSAPWGTDWWLYRDAPFDEPLHTAFCDPVFYGVLLSYHGLANETDVESASPGSATWGTDFGFDLDVPLFIADRGPGFFDALYLDELLYNTFCDAVVYAELPSFHGVQDQQPGALKAKLADVADALPPEAVASCVCYFRVTEEFKRAGEEPHHKVVFLVHPLVAQMHKGSAVAPAALRRVLVHALLQIGGELTVGQAPGGRAEASR